MAVTQSLIGLGAYSLPYAARLLDVSTQKMSYWVGSNTALLRRQIEGESEVITFIELMELFFVKMFRDKGVSLPAIRKAAEAASKKFHTDYPFTVKRFDTDGRTIFATLISEEKELVEDLHKGQYVFDNVMRPFFKKLEYGKHDELRYWPLKRNGRVVLDPKRNFGHPIDSETGVPTKALYDAVKAGGGQDSATVAKWFDVPQKAVDQAVRFEKQLVA